MHYHMSEVCLKSENDPECLNYLKKKETLTPITPHSNKLRTLTRENI